ncbi:tyrosine-type recombinase/integrase [Candidatus Gracilibacteria bacterium]|nr:tyrosine-type recombinase/integrase [Candidatus Gracilibacteria bacterium]NJM86130.1 tyrosine-type recombinase/integrase [Hydrococcus sp. RU_2_2]
MNQNRTREAIFLEQSYLAEIAPSFPDLTKNPDVLTQLLEDKRNKRTRHEYRKDINDFFKTVTGSLPTPDTVLQLLHLDRHRATALVLKYKAELFKRGLSEATVNRRLAAIKALVAMGRKLGVCDYSLEDVKGEKVQTYRDTSGVTPELYKQVLANCDLATQAGKRDYALLKLLWGNALRRNEVSQLNIGDFDPDAKTIKVLGKGKGTQFEIIDLSGATTEALLQWLKVSGTKKKSAPLFISLDFHHFGHRLTGDGIYKIVRKYCQMAGITKPMSPHRVRHSSITAALDATDGNVRKVQKLSRHANLDTLMRYDDNRRSYQLEVTELLDELI